MTDWERRVADTLHGINVLLWEAGERGKPTYTTGEVREMYEELFPQRYRQGRGPEFAGTVR